MPTLRSTEAGSYPHGTANRYRNLGCRCDPCREAWVAYHGEWRRQRVEMGYCADCGSGAEPGMYRCAKHRTIKRLNVRRAAARASAARPRRIPT